MSASRDSVLGAMGSGKLTELKQRLLFVVLAMIVFRIGSFIPVPGIDPAALASLFEQQKGTILDMFNMFSGGALGRLSLFALGVMPYISSSIIMQLLTAVVPKLEQLKKEGESGRRKITQYTRYGTFGLATFQAIGISIALQGQTIGSFAVVPNPGSAFIFTAVVSLVTGTMFLMWLGEQVTERGIGNGISLIIFAGIAAGLPSAIGGTLELARIGEISAFLVLILLILAIGVTGFVVFMERGQRRITVNYAKRQQGRKMYAAQKSHLPLKVNMAGVIPPIFASSIILFPATLGGWFGSAEGMGWLKDISSTLSPGQPVYVLMYALAIIFFCFFYTAVTFNPDDVAENLKKNGGFVPGIRPGKKTSEFIDKVLTRLTVVGAIYLGTVCVLPTLLISKFNIPFYFGGTALLIVVGVAIDTISKIESHLVMRNYEGFMKAGKIKGRN